VRTIDTVSMAQRLRAEEIEELLAQYRESGLTRVEYSRLAGIGVSTLGRYLRRSRNTEQQLVRVKVEAAEQRDTGFVLLLGNGRRIASGWEFGDAALARLIRVAETA
jgi:predicted transcriptional regulator